MPKYSNDCDNSNIRIENETENSNCVKLVFRWDIHCVHFSTGRRVSILLAFLSVNLPKWAIGGGSYLFYSVIW